MDSTCGRGKNTAFELATLGAPASTSEWTFISVIRKNSSSDTYLRTASNLEKHSKPTDLAPGGLCLFDPESMINALEINYPMLISPIMLIPEAIPFANVQQTYLQGRAQMVSRQGPRLSARFAKEDSKIVVKKRDFTPRTVLIAPPIVFQVCVFAVCVFAHARARNPILSSCSHVRLCSPTCFASMHQTRLQSLTITHTHTDSARSKHKVCIQLLVCFH